MNEANDRADSDSVERWVGIGLLSREGKEAGDRRKVDNTRTQPEIFADMLGIEPGRPELPLPSEAILTSQALAAREGLRSDTLVIGLNTGAGGRWTSKELPVERVIAYADALARSVSGSIAFLVLGGPPEAGRNREIIEGIRAIELPAELASDRSIQVLDAGVDNDLPTFAALVGLCDLLLTSDSLALHIGVAMNVRIVSFFAPTPAAEIELYDLGVKVQSTTDDYCSYSKRADTSTITVERLVEATSQVLAAKRDQRRLIPRPA